MSGESRKAPLLFDAFPELAKDLPWTPLADVPTAVEPCTALEAWLGRSGVWMKRDDLVSSLYGGNKVRRYEFVLADAKAKGRKRIVTVGGIASTQVMATALFGKKLDFDVRAVLFEQPVTRFAQTSIKGFAASGAELIYGGGYVGTIVRAWRAYHREKDNYFIMPGAANALANIGYVDAMLELAGQVERGEMPRPDVIVLPTGSSGTLAALALGAAHLGWNTEILGVRITTALASNRLMVNTIVRATDRFLAARTPRWRRMSSRVNYTLYGGALGKGYGHPTPAAVEGASRLESLTGKTGEVTYSGKALAALHDLATTPAYADKTILLWNTLSTTRPEPPDDAPVPADLRWILSAPTVA